MWAKYFGLWRDPGIGRGDISEVSHRRRCDFGVSRSVPTFTNVAKSSYWIQADLGNSEESAHKVTETLGAIPLDILIYNVGVWEEKAFSEAYDFESVPASEITKMVTTNFTSAILNIQSVITELAIIEECEDYSDRFHLGAESSGQRVGIFGNEIWLKRNCGIVAGNRARRSDWRFSFEFGYLATEFTIDVPVNMVLEESDYSLIPLQDVLLAIQFIAATSPATCVKEIIMPAMADENV